MQQLLLLFDKLQGLVPQIADIENHGLGLVFHLEHQILRRDAFGLVLSILSCIFHGRKEEINLLLVEQVKGVGVIC